MQHKEIAFSQLKRRLSESEQDGSIAKQLGLAPKRKRQLSQKWLRARYSNPQSVLCVHPL